MLLYCCLKCRKNTESKNPKNGIKIEKKITDHNHDKYISTSEFNKFTKEILYLRLKRATLARKSDVANFLKKKDSDNKLKHVASSKNEINVLSKKVKAVSTKRLKSYLIDKFKILNEAKYFSLGMFQNYSVFIPTKKYIKYFSGTTQIESWTSSGMSEENIENTENITKSKSNFAPTSVDHNLWPDIYKNNISIPKKVINLYISYTLGPQLRNLNTDFTLCNCLFGSIKLAKNADVDKYKYTDYSIEFDSRS